MEYILIIAMWSGALSSADSAALTSVNGFKSRENCEAAGRNVKEKFSTIYKKVEFVCAVK